MSRPLRIQLIEDEAALEALQPEWHLLWRRAKVTPFQSPEWLVSWWKAFAPGKLHVIGLRDGEDLIGLAPLYLEHRTARLLPLGISVSDYLDTLIEPGRLRDVAAAMSAVLGRGGWTSCHWPDLAPDAAAAQFPCLTAHADAVEPGTVCPELKLPDSVEGLAQIFPARKRRTLRMIANRAARRGQVKMLSHADRSPEAMLDELFRLHGLRWRSQGEAGVLADPRLRDFHRSAVPRLAEAGVLRLYALQIGDAIAAVYYGFLQDQRAYGYLTGFDPAFEFESPGTLLLEYAIQEAVREGARYFDFLRGSEAYKYEWGAVDRQCMRRTIRPMEAHTDGV
jgi:CelD/BcsL family acetyltransferase involved in cellulose biosynthesis